MIFGLSGWDIIELSISVFVLLVAWYVIASTERWPDPGEWRELVRDRDERQDPGG